MCMNRVLSTFSWRAYPYVCFLEHSDAVILRIRMTFAVRVQVVANLPKWEAKRASRDELGSEMSWMQPLFLSIHQPFLRESSSSFLDHM